MIKQLFILLLFPLAGFSQSIRFNEVGESKGLTFIYPGNDFQMAGGGLMVIDANNDGWEDLFQAGGVFPSKLWINRSGKFEDGTKEFHLDELEHYFIQGAVSADYNKDGFQDFVIANYGTGMSRGDKFAPVLLKNVGGKYFEKISLDSILPKGNYASACWGDINNDGWIDVYFCNYVQAMGTLEDSHGKEVGYNPVCFENRLLINHNGQFFTEEALKYGVNNSGCSLAARFHDMDKDGDQDLMLLNDFGEWTSNGNRYFQNDFPQEHFADKSMETGFYSEMYGMGVGIGDYKNNGQPEFYITNIGQNRLLNFNDGVFTDRAKELGVDLTFVKDSIRGTSWTPLFFDADMDGDLDLYVTKGNVATLVPKTAIKDPNAFFENQDGKFVNKSKEAGLDDILSHRGAVSFDYDHDGDLDIISSVVKLPWAAFQGLEQKIKLYENVSTQGNWIAVKILPNAQQNKDAFGAQITFKQGGKLQTHVLDAGSGQASQSSRTVFFGLGNNTVLEEVTVIWPNGTTNSYKNLKAKKIHSLKQEG